MARALNPAYVRSQIELLCASHPDIMDDEEMRSLAIASETDLHAFLDALVDRKDKIEEHLPGLEKRISDHRARKERYERQVEMLRTLALKLMDAAGVRKVELDQATLSVATGPRKVIITDFAALPESCIRIKREPDKTAIKQVLAEGQPVPGAELSNAEPYLNVRTK